MSEVVNWIALKYDPSTLLLSFPEARTREGFMLRSDEPGEAGTYELQPIRMLTPDEVTSCVEHNADYGDYDRNNPHADWLLQRAKERGGRAFDQRFGQAILKMEREIPNCWKRLGRRIFLTGTRYQAPVRYRDYPNHWGDGKPEEISANEDLIPALTWKRDAQGNLVPELILVPMLGHCLCEEDYVLRVRPRSNK